MGTISARLAHGGECGPERLSTPATIAWVSDGEKAQPRRRRGRRRGRRSAGSVQGQTDNGAIDKLSLLSVNDIEDYWKSTYSESLKGKNAGPTGSVLMIDANQVWDVSEAIDYVTSLKEIKPW